ncbi:uncharacterized protein MONBRDRAFT_12537 [Monosiga brevicollis MX1]|uniref:Uncharacterized protein n=1 Tax=Monosiga brevicollis TaxID=81824 RepID=A9VCK7_MONBE|nr:uncharacterized protein MONBRDRAFT_12537 [Monosiga brevicollis MX1]EDQ84803.1 predicted protein [Monosiga brevicollis MX1]|eukprot:XP_001750453.1 hypothetical protein [Monosiga brevicollis MX1]
MGCGLGCNLTGWGVGARSNSGSAAVNANTAPIPQQNAITRPIRTEDRSCRQPRFGRRGAMEANPSKQAERATELIVGAKRESECRGQRHRASGAADFESVRLRQGFEDAKRRRMSGNGGNGGGGNAAGNSGGGGNNALGAQFCRVVYGNEESALINLDCRLRHIMDFLADLLDMEATAQLDLASERGRLCDVPGQADMDARGTSAFKAKAVYVPVLYTQGVSPKLGDSLGSNTGSQVPSRPGSSRSLVGRQASNGKQRRGDAEDGGGTKGGGNSDDQGKRIYNILCDATYLQTVCPSFELTLSNGGKIKKQHIRR